MAMAVKVSYHRRLSVARPVVKRLRQSESLHSIARSKACSVSTSAVRRVSSRF